MSAGNLFAVFKDKIGKKNLIVDLDNNCFHITINEDSWIGTREDAKKLHTLLGYAFATEKKVE